MVLVMEVMMVIDDMMMVRCSAVRARPWIGTTAAVRATSTAATVLMVQPMRGRLTGRTANRTGRQQEAGFGAAVRVACSVSRTRERYRKMM